MTLRDAPGPGHGVLYGLNETVSPVAWEVKMSEPDGRTNLVPG